MTEDVVLCGLGRPITSERIAKYEKMIHFLIHRHFPSLVFPSMFDYDDMTNQCREQIFAAFKKLDPQKALSCRISNPIRNAAKLAEKQADPEKAFRQAEKNLVYWAIDNHLRRVKYAYGSRTAHKKRRGHTVSLETMLSNGQAVGLSTSESGLFNELSQSALSSAQEQNTQALISSLLWFMRFRGPAKAKTYFEKMPEAHKLLVVERLRFVADRSSAPSLVTRFVESAPDDDSESNFV